jgi:hypothetical protein
MKFISHRIPNLASRALELDLMQLPGTTYKFFSGRELVYRLKIAPSEVSRLYTCELHVKPGVQSPEMIVVEPDLSIIAGGKRLPHVYPYNKKGTKLCLWNPRYQEWCATMKLIDTYIPWTARWLWYFENWLLTSEWAGGGEHPTSRNRHARHARSN